MTFMVMWATTGGDAQQDVARAREVLRGGSEEPALVLAPKMYVFYLRFLISYGIIPKNRNCFTRSELDEGLAENHDMTVLYPEALGEPEHEVFGD